MDDGLSIWLEPNKSSRTKLNSIIQKLSKKFDFPNFEPHITLFGRVNKPYKSIKLLINNLVCEYRPFNLIIDNFQIGTHPWKMLYFSIRPDNYLNVLQSKINKNLKNYRAYKFIPHISIAYGKIDNLETELEGIIIPKRIYFDSISIVQISNDIMSWKKLRSFSLRK